MATKVLLALALTALLPLPLIAQTYSRVDVYGGYQLQALSDQNRSYDGYKIEGAVNARRDLAFVGEFAYGTQSHGEEGLRSTDRKYTYLGGFRVNIPLNRVRVFAQLLLGAYHKTTRVVGQSAFSNIAVDDTYSNNGFAFSSGAGIEFMISDLISLRPAQVDLLASKLGYQYGNSEWEKHLRYSAGIVFKLGHAGK